MNASWRGVQTVTAAANKKIWGSYPGKNTYLSGERPEPPLRDDTICTERVRMAEDSLAAAARSSLNRTPGPALCNRPVSVARRVSHWVMPPSI